ncbi:MAG: hypothetical protein GXO22_03475 [Aquificae bacterium]|nr:hypothetical protein [Aquificota bacterium]
MHQKHYIAGLLDSCGKISIVKVKNSPNSVYIKVILRSSDKEVLNIVKNTYGGNLREGKKVCSLTLTHNKAKNLLEDIKDLLVAKKKEAQIVLKLYETRFTRKFEAQRKKEIVREFLKLNSKRPQNIKNGKSSLYKWIEE